MRSVCPRPPTPTEELFRTSQYPNLPIVLEKLADKTGKTNFYKLASHGMNGAFHLDNSWHHGWETVAALIATTKATPR
ncbi:hypothetical protein ACWEPD_30610 [Streptomyces pseudogriseolus]